MDKIRCEYGKGRLIVAPLAETLKGNRMCRYGHTRRREETHVSKKVMRMNVDR